MHSSMMPGTNSSTQPSAGCVELLVSPTCTGDSWDGANLPHSSPISAAVVPVGDQSSVDKQYLHSSKEIPMNFSVYLFPSA